MFLRVHSNAVSTTCPWRVSVPMRTILLSQWTSSKDDQRDTAHVALFVAELLLMRMDECKVLITQILYVVSLLIILYENLLCVMTPSGQTMEHLTKSGVSRPRLSSSQHASLHSRPNLMPGPSPAKSVLPFALSPSSLYSHWQTNITYSECWAQMNLLKAGFLIA